MARVLIADTPEGVANLERILNGHELVTAGTMSAALNALNNQTFDLIVVGVHFDESRMFELIPLVKKTKKNARKPVICFCTRDTSLTRTMHKALDCSSRAIGAWMYLDQHEYNVSQNPDAELRRVIERCLTHQDRKDSLAKRGSIDEERAEIHELRTVLEAEKWSDELQDRLGDLRRRLSKILLELYEAYQSGDLHQENIERSRDLHDRVSDSVTQSENDMTTKERKQRHKETEQSIREQEISDKEESKGQKARRRKMFDDKTTSE